MPRYIAAELDWHGAVVERSTSLRAGKVVLPGSWSHRVPAAASSRYRWTSKVVLPGATTPTCVSSSTIGPNVATAIGEENGAYVRGVGCCASSLSAAGELEGNAK